MNKTWGNALFAVQYMGGVTYPRKWLKNFGICEKVRVESNIISEPEIMK